MIDLTPSPIAFSIGTFSIHWYGIAYAVGLAVVYLVISHEARWRGLDVRLLPNAMIVVAIAALIGGRLYHVIDQWQLYKDDPCRIVLPPYAGLGVYGGIIAGTITALLYARWKRQPFLLWADAVAPGLFVMQAIARWGNFFNQELYGAPDEPAVGDRHPVPVPDAGISVPAGLRPTRDPRAALPADVPLRVAVGPPRRDLFLIWLARRFAGRLRPGDLLLVFFIWYGSVRFVVESLKADNWIFFGVPTAQIFAVVTAVGAAVILVVRHLRAEPSQAGPPEVTPETVIS